MAEMRGENSMLIRGLNYTVIKKAGNEDIPRHNHPEANVLFTVVKGKVEVTIDEEIFIAEPGHLLHFDGNQYISARMLEESEIFVTLIAKPTAE